MFSAAVRFGRSLKSWKTQPRFRRRSGTFEPLSRAEVAAADDDPAGGRLDLLQRRRTSVDLPDPDAPDDEDELALLDDERDAVERRHVIRLVDLADVLEDDHRGAGRALLRRLLLRGRIGFGEGRHLLSLRVVIRHRA